MPQTRRPTCRCPPAAGPLPPPLFPLPRHRSFGRVYRGFLDLPPGCELSATLSSLSATLSARLAAAAAGDGQRQGPLQLPVAIKVLENADIPAFIKEAGERCWRRCCR